MVAKARCVAVMNRRRVPVRGRSPATSAGRGGRHPRCEWRWRGHRAGVCRQCEVERREKGLAARCDGEGKTAFTDMDKDRNGQLEVSRMAVARDSARSIQSKRSIGQKALAARPWRQKGQAFVERPDQPRSSDGKFLLTSPVVEDMKELPQEFTGDGEAASPPLAWTGAPGTKSYALIMDHADKEGNMKWYWTQYDIPAGTTSLAKMRTISANGHRLQRRGRLRAPMSKGAGSRTYVITMYALNEPLNVAGKPGREELLVVR